MDIHGSEHDHQAGLHELTAGVEALLQQESSICLLLDLEEFEGEKIKAWGADFKFGHEYRKKIAKLAVVGDKQWQEWMTTLIDQNQTLLQL